MKITKRVLSNFTDEDSVVDDLNSGQKPDNPEAINKDRFQKMVAERAYFKSEKKGFVSGHEMEDWLAAESEIKSQYFYWTHDIE
jgi:hypothetical protein